MQKLNREIGSSFYELYESDGEFQALKQHIIDLNIRPTYYYSGRNAILALLKSITKKQTINTIWLPQYYCDTVVKLVCANFNNVGFYSINPFEHKSDLDINFFASQNDIVILNNFWGLSTFSYPDKNRAVIIEDYSHAWLSYQSLHSKADYCFCSLRKTYPIPLGAIIWKPNADESFSFYENVEDKYITNALEKFQNSMALKRQYIKENKALIKSDYLTLLSEGETILSLSNNYLKPKEKLVTLLKTYLNLDSNPLKGKHLKYLYEHLNTSPHFKIIKREGFTSFGLLLLFKDSLLFESFKLQMIANQIYPAHLWPHNNLNNQWKYLYNIHVDFRYNLEDMSYLCDTINTWTKNIL